MLIDSGKEEVQKLSLIYYQKIWDSWITELEEQPGCTKVKLQKGQYLSDILQ